MFSKNNSELYRQAWLKKTLAALPAGARILYFKLRGNKRAEDVACFGWHCVGVKAK